MSNELAELLRRPNLNEGEIATAFVLAVEEDIKLEWVRIDLTGGSSEVMQRNFDVEVER